MNINAKVFEEVKDSCSKLIFDSCKLIKELNDSVTQKLGANVTSFWIPYYDVTKINFDWSFVESDAGVVLRSDDGSFLYAQAQWR